MKDRCEYAKYLVVTSTPVQQVLNARYSKRCVTVFAKECGKDVSYEVFPNGNIERVKT